MNFVSILILCKLIKEINRKHRHSPLGSVLFVSLIMIKQTDKRAELKMIFISDNKTLETGLKERISKNNNELNQSELSHVNCILLNIEFSKTEFGEYKNSKKVF